MNTRYLLPPSFRKSVLLFLSSRPRSDATAGMLEQRLRDLRPSFVVDHTLCQRMVDYLKAFPYEQIYQLVAGFGALEPVPDSEQLEPQLSSSDGNGSSDEEQPPHAVSVFGASAKLG